MRAPRAPASGVCGAGGTGGVRSDVAISRRGPLDARRAHGSGAQPRHAREAAAARTRDALRVRRDRTARRDAGAGADGSVHRPLVAPGGLRPGRAGRPAHAPEGGPGIADARHDPPGDGARHADAPSAHGARDPADVLDRQPVRPGDQGRRHRCARRDGARAHRGATAHARRAAAAARRALAGSRQRRAVRDRLPAAGGAGAAARRLGAERTGDVDDRRVLARPPARRGAVDRRPGHPVPRGVRPRRRHGHPGVVRADQAQGGRRTAPAGPARLSATRPAASCSTSPTRRCPTPTRRRRCGSCPSTTTRCSATRTAPA